MEINEGPMCSCFLRHVRFQSRLFSLQGLNPFQDVGVLHVRLDPGGQGSRRRAGTLGILQNPPEVIPPPN